MRAPAALLLLALLSGCVTVREFREQHCARLCLADHGPRPPDGVYSIRVRGDQCSCVLWGGRTVLQGLMDRNWKPE